SRHRRPLPHSAQATTVSADIYQIQNANLGALAKDKVWLSCTIILPLHAQGGAGSPVRPVAIGGPSHQQARVSTCPHLPSQIAKSGSFANELNAKQYAKQPDRSYREAGPKIESDQYCNEAARQEPTPVRKGPYRQRKDHLRNALNHEVHEQQ